MTRATDKSLAETIAERDKQLRAEAARKADRYLTRAGKEPQKLRPAKRQAAARQA